MLKLAPQLGFEAFNRQDDFETGELGDIGVVRAELASGPLFPVWLPARQYREIGGRVICRRAEKEDRAGLLPAGKVVEIGLLDEAGTQALFALFCAARQYQD